MQNEEMKIAGQDQIPKKLILKWEKVDKKIKFRTIANLKVKKRLRNWKIFHK